MRRDGTELANVTNSPESDEYVFRWSPDGEKLLYISKIDGDADIYVVNHDGTERENLTNNSYDDFAPQWVY
jgi:TolB protein